MSGKWQVEELKVGAVMEATFWQNPVSESQFRFRATHLDGKRAPKVVLCDDPRIRAGEDEQRAVRMGHCLRLGLVELVGPGHEYSHNLCLWGQL